MVTARLKHVVDIVDAPQGTVRLKSAVSKADELRKRGTEPSGTTVESVQHYEIPLTVGAKTRT